MRADEDAEAAAPLLIPSASAEGVDVGSSKTMIRTLGMYLVTALACFGLLALLGEHVFHDPLRGNEISPGTQRPSSALSSTADAGLRSAGAVAAPPRAYVVNAPVNLKLLRNVYQIGNPRSASTYQWYLLCSILRVVIDDGRPVLCDENAERFWQPDPPDGPGAVRLFKIHPVADPDDEEEEKEEQGKLTTRANRLPPVAGAPAPTPQTDVVFASLRPEEGAHSAKMLEAFRDERFNLAYTQVYDDFVRAGVGDIASYASVFHLDDARVKTVWEHMRYYAIIRKCCGVQASSLQRAVLTGNVSDPGSGDATAAGAEAVGVASTFRIDQDPDLSNGNLVKSTQDFDFTACSAYDLNVVEKLFLQTALAQTHPGQLYGAQIPMRFFDTHPAFEYVIQPGYCHKTLHQMSHGMGFGGLTAGRRAERKEEEEEEAAAAAEPAAAAESALGLTSTHNIRRRASYEVEVASREGAAKHEALEDEATARRRTARERGLEMMFR